MVDVVDFWSGSVVVDEKWWWWWFWVGLGLVVAMAVTVI